MATAAEFVKIASAEVGYREGAGNRTKYGQWFGADGQPYCAIFVSWCFAQVGMGDKMPRTASAGEFGYAAIKRGMGTYHAKGSGYSPRGGDLFLENYTGGSYADHMGVVIENCGDGTIKTADGNYSNGVTLVTRQAGRYCYITPPFDAASGSSGGAASDGTETYMYSENSYENTDATVVWNERKKENIQPTLQATNPIEAVGEISLYAGGENITKIAGNLSWENSIYELATTMSFEVAKTDAAYLRDVMYQPQIGDVVQLVAAEEIFRGVIIQIDDGDTAKNTYSAADMGWYLNKSSQTYQFRNISVAAAIREICEDLTINIVTMPTLETNVNLIYFDKTISDIITDLLSKCGGNYNYDFVPDGIRIYEIGTFVANPEFLIADNIPPQKSTDRRGEVSHSLSIEDMKNSVKITSEKDNVYSELLIKQNRELIDKYGFLQEIVKIDPEKENAETVAAEKLASASAPTETYSFKIIEKYDSYTRAGEVITVDDVNYIIEHTQHSFTDGWHFTTLELKKQ